MMTGFINRHKLVLFLSALALIFLLYSLCYQLFFTLPIPANAINTSIYEPEEKYVVYFTLEDSNVLASQSGEVAYVGLDATGKMSQVTIKHSFGYSSEYRGLLSDMILVSVGQKVKRGQPVASIRISGEMSPSDATTLYSNNVLNFLVIRNSIPIEPTNYLKNQV